MTARYLASADLLRQLLALLEECARATARDLAACGVPAAATDAAVEASAGGAAAEGGAEVAEEAEVAAVVEELVAAVEAAVVCGLLPVTDAQSASAAQAGSRASNAAPSSSPRACARGGVAHSDVPWLRVAGTRLEQVTRYVAEAQQRLRVLHSTRAHFRRSGTQFMVRMIASPESLLNVCLKCNAYEPGESIIRFFRLPRERSAELALAASIDKCVPPPLASPLASPLTRAALLPPLLPPISPRALAGHPMSWRRCRPMRRCPLPSSPPSPTLRALATATPRRLPAAPRLGWALRSWG